jgi:HTH-type transcriptional regulator/antitoxin HigA
MVKRGWIEHSSNPEVLEQRLLEFFSIKDLDEAPSIMPAAARMSASYDALTGSQWAWMCRAIHLSKTIRVNSRFEPKKLDALIEELHRCLKHPEEIRRVPQVLAEAGIRLLVIEHLAKTKIDGACLWLDEESPVIAVSLRYDRIDYFWFTLMHELGHARHGDGLAFPALDVRLVGEQSLTRDEKPDFEIRADAFAEEALISQSKLDDFIVRKGPLFSEKDIRGFASLHEVHPGLVVGQLHHRGTRYSKFRHLLVRMRDQLTSSALTAGWGHVVPATA